MYKHCIYTFRIFRFVSFAELGCRLQRLRVEVVVQNLGNVWNAGESVEVPHQTFQHSSTAFRSGFLKCARSPPPAPPSKKTGNFRRFPKSYLKCDAILRFIQFTQYFQFLSSLWCILFGLKTEVLLHSINPKDVWRHATFQYTDASCDLEKQPGLCKVLIFGGSRMLQGFQIVGLMPIPSLQSWKWFFLSLQYVNLPSWLICHHLLCTGNGWLPSPSWFWGANVLPLWPTTRCQTPWPKANGILGRLATRSWAVETGILQRSKFKVGRLIPFIAMSFM